MNKMIMELANDVTELTDRHAQNVEEYCAALSSESAARSAMSEASTALEDCRSELLAEMTISAKLDKSGPLAGIAASDTKGRAAIINSQCKANPQCLKLARALHTYAVALQECEIASEQAKQRMKATAAVLDAKATVLAALGNVSN